MNIKYALFGLFFIISLHGNSIAENLDILGTTGTETDLPGALLRSPSVDVLYISSEKDNKEYMAYNFGVKIPGISFNDTRGRRYVFGGYGGIFTRYQLHTESFNFVHADFLGALFLQIDDKHLLFETSVYHISSHLGDDYINNNTIEVADTGFEALKQDVLYRFTPTITFHIGAEYKLGRRPLKTIFYNKSLFLGAMFDGLPQKTPVFFESELEIIGDYSPNLGIKAGVYLNYLINNFGLNKPPPANEHHEFSIYYYNGYSKMGYFYDQREQLLMCGFTFRYYKSFQNPSEPE
jgi:hypothetical protein